MKISEYPNLKERLKRIKWVNGHVPAFLQYAGYGFLALVGLLMIISAFFAFESEAADYLMIIIFTAFAAAGIFGIVHTVKQKKLYEHTFDNISLQELAAVESAGYASAASMGSCLMMRDFLIGKGKYGLFALKPENILWLYGTRITRRVNGIPVGTFYNVTAANMEGSTFVLGDRGIAGEAQMQEMISHLRTWCLSAGSIPLTGFSQEYANMLKKDLPGLIRRQQEYAANRPQQNIWICPYCGTENTGGVCTGCQWKNSAADLEESVEPVSLQEPSGDRPVMPEPPQKTRKGEGLIIAGLIAAMALVVAGGLYLTRTPSSPSGSAASSQSSSSALSDRRSLDLSNVEAVLKKYADDSRYSAVVDEFMSEDFAGSDDFYPSAYVVELDQGSTKSIFVTLNSDGGKTITSQSSSDYALIEQREWNSRGTSQKYLFTGEAAGAEIVRFANSDSDDAFSILVIVR